MEVSARHRFEMHQELKKVLGDTVADTLMEHLPPNGWSDVVRLGDLAPIHAHFEVIDKRFEQIDRRFDEIDKRFDIVDKRFEEIDRRFEEVDKRFNGLDARLDRLDNKFTVSIITTISTALALAGLILQAM